MEPFERELEGQYTLLQTIGAGAFAKVKLAIHVLTEEKVAIKIIDKCSIGKHLYRVYLEIAALRDFAHQYICKLYQVIESKHRMYLVLEYCPGGELLDYVMQRERLDEDKARHFFRQIVSAVAYVHRRGYAHRDLKPENLLLDAHGNIKLVDFGLCAKTMPGMGAHLRTACGSSVYAAPELVAGREYVGSVADIWSMGVLLYVLLCGRLPFSSDNTAALFRLIQAGQYKCPETLSERCVHLLSRMMTTSPERRITMAQLVNHPWLVEGYGCPVSVESTCSRFFLDDEVVSEMAVGCGRPKHSVVADINRRKCDYTTATYHLLVEKKNRGGTIRLPVRHPRATVAGASSQNHVVKRLAGITSKQRSAFCNLTERFLKQLAVVRDNIGGIRARLPLPASKELREGRLDLRGGDNNATTRQEFLAPARTTQEDTRKVLALPAPPALDLPYEHGEPFSSSATIAAKSLQKLEGADLRQGHRMPATCDDAAGTSSARIGVSATHVFNIVEKGLSRMRLMLTSRQRSQSGLVKALQGGPRKVGKVQNVSSVPDTLTPNQVLDCLGAALQRIGIVCKKERHTLWGELLDGRGEAKLTFELEIVKVQQPGLLGIARKRLTGDAWHYKRVCEEVLKLSAAPL
ncbi:hypothetical protein HPB50_024234 [Hyalomma asiaticum]|uniref:Uncharacterized protein n=1 Tax=Hyalomma asiaticum TaxID=266040 RepID=A0ACB7SIP3_HYAAI|nr:hypothetical protein HPB50_024234 [Hyalomma asiaticum]